LSLPFPALAARRWLSGWHRSPRFRITSELLSLTSAFLVLLSKNDHSPTLLHVLREQRFYGSRRVNPSHDHHQELVATRGHLPQREFSVKFAPSD
jgi:hypothetical protein